MIPLLRARLCLDEEVVYDGAAGEACPGCGSRKTWSLAKWLNRTLQAAVIKHGGRHAPMRRTD